jgi:hypothetical protein
MAVDVAYALGLALTAHAMGDQTLAQTLGDQGLALLREADAKGELMPGLARLGQAALARGDLARAALLLGQGPELSIELGDKRGIVTILEGVTGLVAARGGAAVGLSLFAAADVMCHASRLVSSTANGDARDRAVATARARRGDRRRGLVRWRPHAARAGDGVCSRAACLARGAVDPR